MAVAGSVLKVIPPAGGYRRCTDWPEAAHNTFFLAVANEIILCDLTAHHVGCQCWVQLLANAQVCGKHKADRLGGGILQHSIEQSTAAAALEGGGRGAAAIQSWPLWKVAAAAPLGTHWHNGKRSKSVLPVAAYTRIWTFVHARPP